MEYVAQIEKTVDILSFLLSKIPLDFDGEGSWLTSSLHVLISELQQQQRLSKENNSDCELFESFNADKKIILLVGDESHHVEKQNVSAGLDESHNTLQEYPKILGSDEFDENTSMKESYVQVVMNSENTTKMVLTQENNLKPERPGKRKYTHKMKAEEKIDGFVIKECEKEKVNQKR